MTTVRALSRAFFDLLLPPVCMACRKPAANADGLCSSCWSRIRFIERPYCERLGVPFAYDLGTGALSADAIADPPPFERARAAAIFDDVARDLVHGLKYRDGTELATILARMMMRAGSELLADADLIVPVPLHRGRLWRRRFNQAAILAGRIAELSEVPVDPSLLQRVRATRHQVGLSLSERDANVRGAFRVDTDAKAEIAGRRILLIDDVLTTGSTAKASTRALLRAGAGCVDILVFARVVGPELATI